MARFSSLLNFSPVMISASLPAFGPVVILVKTASNMTVFSAAIIGEAHANIRPVIKTTAPDTRRSTDGFIFVSPRDHSVFATLFFRTFSGRHHFPGKAAYFAGLLP